METGVAERPSASRPLGHPRFPLDRHKVNAMGRRILITGARRGIGAAIAVGLARPGHHLWLHHLAAADEAETVARLCRDLGAEASLLDADLSDAAAGGEAE